MNEHVQIAEYTPCRSVTPYGSYGSKQANQWRKIMANAGIVCEVTEEQRRIENPIGSGPGGAVRFGDDMLPSTYRLLVPIGQEIEARKALLVSEQETHDWLFNDGPKPHFV